MLRIDDADEESLWDLCADLEDHLFGFGVKHGVIREEIVRWTCAGLGGASGEVLHSLLAGRCGWCFFGGRPSSAGRYLGSLPKE